MIEITKQFRAEIAHRLPNHDGGCRFVHGHSYLFEVTLSARRFNSMEMVMDFSELKDIVKDVIGEWDHSLVLYEEDPLVRAFELNDLLNHNMINLVTIPFIPTAENMADYIAHKVQQEIDDADPGFTNGVHVTAVTVWETTTSYATWRKS